MSDDLVVQVVAQPRSMRKCYLRVCGAELEHEVRAKLVAPARFSTPHARGGKGKASFPGKGVGPSLMSGQKYYKRAVPSFDTPTPEEEAKSPASRCMQQVWVVRRRAPGTRPHLVVLLHAADGRVAIAQLSGENGPIPPLYGTGATGGGTARKTCAIWGAKAWHWGQTGVGGIGQYRRSYDVPKCHEVMAVAVEEGPRILILHRPRARSSPQFWTVSPPRPVMSAVDGSGSQVASFFRIHSKGKGTGGKNKGGKGNSIGIPVGGSWYDDRWGTYNQRQAVLPDDIVSGSLADAGPLLVPFWTGGVEGEKQPDVEVLRFRGQAESANNTTTWQITQLAHYRCQEPLTPH